MNVLSITENTKFVIFYLLFLNILVYLNYRIFLLAFIIFIILGINKDFSFNARESVLLKLIPINYYFNAIYNTFSENPNSSFFWDMQNFLHYLRCNTGPFVYNYRFLNEKISCPDSIGYGLLTEYIKLSFDEIWLITISIGSIFLLITLFFLSYLNVNTLLIITILISPGFHFLVFSLNTDIFIFLYICILLKKNVTGFNNFNFFILTIFTLIKSYTLVLFIGYLLIFILNRQLKHVVLTSVYFIFNTSIVIFHYYIQNSLLPNPISFTRSFGLLHDFVLLNEYIGFDEVAYLAIVLLIIFTLFRKKIDSNRLEISIKKLAVDKTVMLFPLCFLINIYANWGYKFIFNSLFIYIIYESTNKSVRILLIFVNLLSTTYYSIGWGFTENLINFFIISTSKVLFYFYFVFSFYVFILAILNKVNSK
jgi:hypothetical protein